MRSLAEWSRNLLVIGQSSQNDNFGLGVETASIHERDEWSELIEELIGNIVLSSNLAQLCSSTKLWSVKLDSWLMEINQSLIEFEKKFATQTRDVLTATVLPWLRGKLVEKAIGDICLEFSELAKHHKIEAILLTAPDELRPLLKEQLTGATISLSQSKEITILAGHSKVETRIEELFEKLKALLLT